MTKQIEAFKNYIEEVAKKNFSDYDAVEYLDNYSYTDYNNACERIHDFKEENGFASYNLIFTEDEMLKVGVMYSCIRCGAIESEMTKKLNDEWARFTSWYER